MVYETGNPAAHAPQITTHSPSPPPQAMSDLAAAQQADREASKLREKELAAVKVCVQLLSLMFFVGNSSSSLQADPMDVQPWFQRLVLLWHGCTGDPRHGPAMGVTDFSVSMRSSPSATVSLQPLTDLQLLSLMSLILSMFFFKGHGGT